MALRRGRAGKGDEPPPEQKVSCYERALRLLGVRAHFRAELRRKLTSRGYAAEEVDATLDRLVAERYLDDETAATQLAAAGRERKEWGSVRVRAELARRGASRPAIEGAVADETVDEEIARARTVAQRWRRLHPRRTAEDDEGLAQLVGYLRRKGFSSRAVSAAVSSRGGVAIELEGEDDESSSDFEG